MANNSRSRQRIRRPEGISSIPKVHLPQPDIAALLSRDFGIEVGDTAVQSWEVGRNEPSIHVYARWARCVGKRLDVQVLDVNDKNVAVRVPAELADVARTIGELSPAKASAALAIAERLLEMTPGEVKALAFDLQRQHDE